jgi:addiction module HigA family antidote
LSDPTSNWSIIGITIEVMMMHNPPHPGEVLRDEIIAALGLSVTEAASRLAMSRVALSRVLNGKAAISPDLAVRLEQAGASTARAWLAMQVNHDLWRAKQHKQPPVRPLQDAA